MGVNPRRQTASPFAAPELIILPDQIDITNAQFSGGELRAAFGHGVPAVADMTQTQLCDSSGIRHLLLANDRAAETNAEFMVVVRSSAVLRAFSLVGADRLLAVYPNLEAALRMQHLRRLSTRQGQPLSRTPRRSPETRHMQAAATAGRNDERRVHAAGRSGPAPVGHEADADQQ